MRSHRWFLPETPDVLGLLRGQAAVTVEGMDSLVAWAHGEPGAGDRVRESEHRADVCKRALREALTVAFTTALVPEDLFELSRSLDEILNSAKDTVREAEVMHTAPNRAIAQMTEQLAIGAGRLAEAFAALSDNDSSRATQAADAAVKAQRRLEHVYRAAMSALVDIDDLRQVSALRELYRRLSRTSDHLVDTAERVWYSVLKES